MARKLASSHGLEDDDLVISRAALEDLQSKLYCLQAAVDDVRRDLERGQEPDDVREAFDWLLENAVPVAQVWIEPRTTQSGTPHMGSPDMGSLERQRT